MENQIVPNLNFEEIQKKANEYAQKGALKAIEEFYTGYNSPYKKEITQQLEKFQIGGNIKLPDIVGLINDTLSHEVDVIANNVVLKTFLPLVTKVLTRTDKEINFSDILKRFIDENDDPDHSYTCKVEYRKDYDWYDITLVSENNYSKYEFTLHRSSQSRKQKTEKYEFLSLPGKNVMNERTARIRLQEGTVLEVPFRQNILSDEFTAYLANLVISGCQITMDVTDFDEDWFNNDED